VGGKVVLLDQQHVEPAPGRVARDRRAVDAAADDEKVEAVHASFLIVMPNRIQHPRTWAGANSASPCSWVMTFVRMGRSQITTKSLAARVWPDRTVAKATAAAGREG
jgi:hypothetical protein